MNNKIKKICICGSMKFKDKIIKYAHKKEAEGNIVFTPVLYLTEEEFAKGGIELYRSLHEAKIEMSDVIVIVNANDYIGTDTRREIEFALSLGKPITYLYPHKK